MKRDFEKVRRAAFAVYGCKAADAGLRQEGNVNNVGPDVVDHMALLTEGAAARNGFYRHCPPTEGEH